MGAWLLLLFAGQEQRIIGGSVSVVKLFDIGARPMMQWRVSFCPPMTDRAEQPPLYRFATRMLGMRPSAIREILKVTILPDVISFAGGLPAPELFPVRDFEQACIDALRNDGRSALQYSLTEGHPPLREWVCSHLAETTGIHCRAEQMMIVTGSQQWSRSHGEGADRSRRRGRHRSCRRILGALAGV